MARPTHFEMPVDDPDRAERFYADVFGWNFQRYEGAPQYYGMASTGVLPFSNDKNRPVAVCGLL